MLSILVSWVLLFIVNYLLGFVVKKILKYQVGFSIQTLLGIIGSSLLCSIIAFFYPINNLVLIGISALCLLIAIINFSVIKTEITNQIKHCKSVLNFGVVSIAGISLAAYSCGYSKINDDGLYYIQTIMWLSKYGFVHGLSNLHVTLGLGSSWHILQSLYSFSTQLHFNDLNGFFLLLYIAYGIENFKTKNYLLSWSQLLIITIISIPFLSAPNPDLAIIIMSAIAFDLFYFKSNLHYLQLILLFAAFSISIKLSAIAISLLAIYSLFHIAKNKTKRNIALFAIICLILSSVLLKNIYQTGHILYPYKTIVFSQIDYTTPNTVMEYYSNGIKTWGISDKYKPIEVNELSKLTYFEHTLALVSRGGFKAIINILFLSIALIILLLTIKAIISKHKNNQLLYFHFVHFISIIFWLTLAPQYRFALPTLLFYIAFMLSFANTYFKNKLDSFLNKELLLLTLVFMFILTIIGFELGINKTSKFIGQIEKLTFKHLVTPMPQYTFQYDSLLLNNTTYYYTNNNRYCWNAPLPCLPASYEKVIANTFKYTLIPRTKDIKDGFKYISTQ